MTSRKYVLQIYPTAYVWVEGPRYAIIACDLYTGKILFISQQEFTPTKAWARAWKQIQKDMVRKLET
jgi:hypothetical protein